MYLPEENNWKTWNFDVTLCYKALFTQFFKIYCPPTLQSVHANKQISFTGKHKTEKTILQLNTYSTTSGYFYSFLLRIIIVFFFADNSLIYTYSYLTVLEYLCIIFFPIFFQKSWMMKNHDFHHYYSVHIKSEIRNTYVFCNILVECIINLIKVTLHIPNIIVACLHSWENMV